MSSKYLKSLEEESIYIIREAIAEFDNPVFLYSIGKDSSVLLHLMLKAFYPIKPTLPVLHIDTGWKFKEMIKKCAMKIIQDIKLKFRYVFGKCI